MRNGDSLLAPRVFTPFPHGHLVFISRREKVRRFVSVDDRFGVGGGQNIGKLPANGHHFLIRQKTTAGSESFGKRLAFQKFHDQKNAAIIRFANVRDLYHARMFDLVYRESLVVKAAHDSFALGEVRKQNFDRNAPTDVALKAFINGPHAPFADQTNDLIVPELVADHR